MNHSSYKISPTPPRCVPKDTAPHLPHLRGITSSNGDKASPSGLPCSSTSPASASPSPQTIWQGFHWSFFINIQGLIVCLQRFEKQVQAQNFVEAEIELKTATELMLASSASMILAGSFSKQEYETQVRETMMPPYVESNNFSGLMSWEHSALIQLWKRLSPIFADLPDSLKPEHQNFANAHKTLANAHRSVCEKFGGSDNGSLRCKENTALNTLDKFNSNRQSLIDPQSQGNR